MPDSTGLLRIIVATDGSSEALAAAHGAAKLFGPDAQIVVAAVVAEQESPELGAGGFEGPLMTEEEAEAEWKDRRDDAKQELSVTARAIGEAVETRLIPSAEDPGRALVQFAIDADADVIVVGATSKGRIRRVFTHSVSNYLVHHAPCPVLVVPLPAEHQQP